MSTVEVETTPDAKKIVDAITTISKQIEEDQSNADAEFKATSKLENGLRADVEIRDFDLTVDEPENLGGNDQGPNPVELVLGAFTSCQEIVIKAYAAVLGIEVNSIHVEAVGHMDLQGFFNLADIRAGYDNVKFKTSIDTPETDQEKLEQLEYFAINKCPVMDILENPVEVEGSIEFTS